VAASPHETENVIVIAVVIAADLSLDFEKGYVEEQDEIGVVTAVVLTAFDAFVDVVVEDAEMIAVVDCTSAAVVAEVVPGVLVVQVSVLVLVA